MAWLDWAGLRRMSELEDEKAARGLLERDGKDPSDVNRPGM